MDGLSRLEPTTIAKATVDDIPWILTLASERYEAFDPGGALTFLLEVLRAPTALMLKSADRNAVLIASTMAPPWYPKRLECQVIMTFARQGAHWQAAKLLRESVHWARLQGCVRWRFHSETKHDVDALCRWVGAHQDRPRYVLDL